MIKYPEKYDKIYIYGLIDPRNNQVKYVGWCVNLKNRMMMHLRTSELKKKTHKNNWLNLLLSENLKPEMIVLEEILPSDYIEKEKYWIKLFGRNNLTNGTDGGDGVLGYEHTKDWKERMSIRMIGNKFNNGKNSTKEHMELMREINKGNTYCLGIKKSDEEKIIIVKNLVGKKRRNFSTSKYVGVGFHKNYKYWTARIKFNKIEIFLGHFQYEIEAALAYNEAALELYGPDARLNKINEEEIQWLWEQD